MLSLRTKANESQSVAASVIKKSLTPAEVSSFLNWLGDRWSATRERPLDDLISDLVRVHRIPLDTVLERLGTIKWSTEYKTDFITMVKTFSWGLSLHNDHVAWIVVSQNMAELYDALPITKGTLRFALATHPTKHTPLMENAAVANRIVSTARAMVSNTTGATAAGVVASLASEQFWACANLYQNKWIADEWFPLCPTVTALRYWMHHDDELLSHVLKTVPRARYLASHDPILLESAIHVSLSGSDIDVIEADNQCTDRLLHSLVEKTNEFGLTVCDKINILYPQETDLLQNLPSAHLQDFNGGTHAGMVGDEYFRWSFCAHILEAVRRNANIPLSMDVMTRVFADKTGFNLSLVPSGIEPNEFIMCMRCQIPMEHGNIESTHAISGRRLPVGNCEGSVSMGRQHSWNRWGDDGRLFCLGIMVFVMSYCKRRGTFVFNGRYGVHTQIWESGYDNRLFQAGAGTYLSNTTLSKLYSVSLDHHQHEIIVRACALDGWVNGRLIDPKVTPFLTPKEKNLVWIHSHQPSQHEEELTHYVSNASSASEPSNKRRKVAKSPGHVHEVADYFRKGMMHLICVSDGKAARVNASPCGEMTLYPSVTFSFGTPFIDLPDRQDNLVYDKLAVGHIKLTNHRSTEEATSETFKNWLHDAMRVRFGDKYRIHFGTCSGGEQDVPVGYCYLAYFIRLQKQKLTGEYNCFISEAFLPLDLSRDANYAFSLFFPMGVALLESPNPNSREIIVTGGYGDYYNTWFRFSLDWVLERTTLNIKNHSAAMYPWKLYAFGRNAKRTLVTPQSIDPAHFTVDVPRMTL